MTRTARSATAALLVLLHAAAGAAVQVVVGPTPIEGGEARSAGDITVFNERLAFSIAVSTPVPYGVPRGAIVDVAPVAAGHIGRDCVVFADFIPNGWSAWPNTFSRASIVERAPGRAVVRTERDWGKVLITTVYTLEAGADAVKIETTMRNGGPALEALLSGPTLWPRRGYFFGLPGTGGRAAGDTRDALALRVSAYDEDWAVSLVVPAADRFADGGKDLWVAHSLAQGESRSFTAWLQVGARGDLQPVVAADLERRGVARGTVEGAVTMAGGTPVEEPVIVAEQGGRPYAWFVGAGGRYRLTLPSGHFELHATGKNLSETARTAVDVRQDATRRVDFGGLGFPGRLRVEVVDARGAPLDARLTIREGQAPLVEYLGRRTYFTELDAKGRLDTPVAPGRYVFEVSAGGDFLSERLPVDVRVEPGKTVAAKAVIPRLFDPPARHWYAADLHHHSDQAEAVTPPRDLARSQLAAGLDLLFVSDHDSSASHAALAAIAARRGVPFIPAMELSASWGHFNAYPLQTAAPPGVDTGTATVQELFKDARRLGAAVIQVNHPLIPYGYFTSVASGSAPGGLDPDFDLVELNAEQRTDDPRVLEAVWKYWNEGRRYYLAGGTDVHDVWNHESGEVRTFAQAPRLDVQAYVQALKEGHAYVSYGPLLYPAIPFGESRRVGAGGVIPWAVDLESAAGLRQVQLIERGEIRATQRFDDAPKHARRVFDLRADRATWYSLVAEDVRGRKAYSDPLWVDLER